MARFLRTSLLLSLMALWAAALSAADVTDVNGIEELKGKPAGTYRFNIPAGTMVYGVYNDKYTGAYLYLWDGSRGLRVCALYEGKMKDVVDASPVGKALTGSVTAIWSPSSNDGCTLVCNTYRDERCSFDASLGEALQLEPKPMTVSEIEAAVNGGCSADFAYVKVHGYTLYVDYMKYMYDDNGDRMMIDNPYKILPYDEFNQAYDNMEGTFTGCVAVSRITGKEGVTVTPSLCVINENWFESEGLRPAEKVVLDADGTYDAAKGYPVADVTIVNLGFKAGVPTLVNMPFAMTADHVTTNFGTEARLYTMSGYSGNHVAADDEAVYDLKSFDYNAGSTSAGSVYVLVPSVDTGELCFEGVSINPSQPEGYVAYTDWSTYNSIYMKGTYGSKEVDASKCVVFGADGEVAPPAAAVKGFTGYFEVSPGVISGKGVKVLLDGVSTSVAGVRVDSRPADGKTYDLCGRRVDAENPARGIYIRNGKKVILR